MTKAEIASGLAKLFKSLPADARVDCRVQRGREESDGPIFVENRENGTMTITIEVNGGAQVTQGQPYYVRNNPELAAIHARNGW